MSGTRRQKDGSTKKINDAGNIIPNFGLRRNWWIISNAYTGDTKGHPAPMPYSMAHDHIQTWTAAQEHILDPFMGSGTTGVSCVKTGRKFIGIELEQKYFDIACKRIEEAYKQPDMFIDAPKNKTQVDDLFLSGDKP